MFEAYFIKVRNPSECLQSLKVYGGLILIIMTFFACNKEPLEQNTKETFIHLSHFRMTENHQFNSQLSTIDFKVYDLRLLGGDLALDTSGDPAVMDTLDRWFDLKSEQTLWALGNHDYNDLNRVESYTNRPPVYTYTYKSICFLVLDTQDDYSNYSGEQLALIKTVLDTLEDSEYLFLLHHKLNWLYGHPDLEAQIDDLANGRFGDCFYCTNPNNFYQEIYPMLKGLADEGTEIYCVGGDLGYHTKTFYFSPDENIHFLASGMNGLDEDNAVIIFEYDPISHKLDWSFQKLD